VAVAVVEVEQHKEMVLATLAVLAVLEAYLVVLEEEQILLVAHQMLDHQADLVIVLEKVQAEAAEAAVQLHLHQ
jgi:hypothetical protein